MQPDIESKLPTLLLLYSLLQFSGTEYLNYYVSVLHKLEDPDLDDPFTLVNLHYKEEIETAGNRLNWHVYTYDDRNPMPVEYEPRKELCFSSDDFSSGNPNEPFIHEAKATVREIDHLKREITISFPKAFTDLHNPNRPIKAVTLWEYVHKPNHVKRICGIANGYFEELGIPQLSPEETKELLKGDEEVLTEKNELAFALLERQTFGSVVVNDLNEIKSAVASLKTSFFSIQGPPGTGKTFCGAHLIHHLIKKSNGAPRTVAITSQSYSAIDNLLKKTVDVFREKDDLSLLKIGRNESKRAPWLQQAVSSGATYLDILDDENNYGSHNLVAAVSWEWVKGIKEDNEKFDYLIIDEAGQFSLFDAVASCASAKNLVLLGDPQQLPQVIQGSHDHGAGNSVLEHIIGDNDVIESERGVLLDRTYRMRSEICNYISEEFYKSQLTPDIRCDQREILGYENGLFWVQAEHEEDRVNSSPEEAKIVRSIIEELMGKPYRLVDGTGELIEGERLITQKDFIVLSPYRAHSQMIRSELSPDLNQIGVNTVDKFQGQENLIVIYSMATSNKDLVPPGRSDFIYKPNRLNVALSRAQCLAVLIASRDLADANASNIGEMADLNHLCRIFEDDDIASEWKFL